MPLTLDNITWDERRQRYLAASGRVLTPKQVRKLIDELVDVSSKRLRNWATQMQTGKLSIAKWQFLSAREVKNLHLATSVIANGGRGQVTPKLWGKLGAQIKFQYQHLRDFAVSVPRKVVDRTGAIPPRAEMYGRAAIGTYENTTLERNKKFGLSIARRETAHGSESCDDCLEQEDLGWQDIKEVATIGDSQCGARCNCVIKYEEVTPADS